jgi:hypothetical protein
LQSLTIQEANVRPFQRRCPQTASAPLQQSSCCPGPVPAISASFTGRENVPLERSPFSIECVWEFNKESIVKDRRPIRRTAMNGTVSGNNSRLANLIIPRPINLSSSLQNNFTRPTGKQQAIGQ